MMYSAGPGQRAKDGPQGDHSTFADVFLRTLDQPGLLLEQVFKEVVKGVSGARTNNVHGPRCHLLVISIWLFRVSCG